MSQAHHKTYALRQKALGTATDAQLAAINAYTLREFSADEVVVREFVLAHNAIDRDKECFDEGLLGDFARTLPGKGCFIRHPGGWDGDSGPGEGRIFGASIEQVSLDDARKLLRQPDLTLPPDRSMVSLLKTQTYFARTTENDALLVKMDAGIVSDVSLGFNASERNRIKGPDGIELNAWRWVGPGEGLEQSLVWLGAQPGARAIKNANRETSTPEESDMDLQQKLDAANAEITTLKAAKTAADESAAKLAALKTALGDNAALIDTPEQLLAMLEAGKGYRDSLVETVVKADRADGTLGDDDKAVADARKEYAAMPMRALKSLAARAEKALEGSDDAGVTGGDPNAAAVVAKRKGATEVPAEFGSKAFS